MLSQVGVYAKYLRCILASQTSQTLSLNDGKSSTNQLLQDTMMTLVSMESKHVAAAPVTCCIDIVQQQRMRGTVAFLASDAALKKGNWLEAVQTASASFSAVDSVTTSGGHSSDYSRRMGALNNVGACHIHRQDLGSALKTFKLSLAQASDGQTPMETFHNLALAFAKLGNKYHRECREALQSLDQRWPIGLTAIGYGQSGDAALYGTLFTRAHVLYYIADVALRVGQLELARKTLKTLCTLSTNISLQQPVNGFGSGNAELRRICTVSMRRYLFVLLRYRCLTHFVM